MLNRLLVVDDQIEFGRFVEEVGKSVGCDVRVSLHALDFKDSVAQWKPSLIIISLAMPEVDGVELLHWLALQHSRTNIIIVGAANLRVIDAARRVGEQRGLNMRFALAKPVSIQDLVEKLELLKQIEEPLADKALLRQEIKTIPAPTAEEIKTILPPPAQEKPVVHVEPNAGSFNREDFMRGLAGGEFILFYQPKISLKTGKIKGAEALARWNHPQHGILPPNSFIFVMEEMGLIDNLTTHILSSVLYQQKIWRAEGFNLQIAVNLSPRNLHSEAFADTIIALCNAEKVPPDSIMLEVTESSDMLYKLEALDIITRLRLQGFEVSIDDFGRGYASLTRLQQLPITEIKIDLSFVLKMLKNPDALVIVQTVIDLARNMRMTSAAEGVETPELYLLLAELGCDVAQGYAIAKPLPANQLRAWSEAWSPPRRQSP
ncbi:MAG: EAL domain-containing response regulator [Alphaproteobacteria bacterium]